MPSDMNLSILTKAAMRTSLTFLSLLLWAVTLVSTGHTQELPAGEASLSHAAETIKPVVYLDVDAVTYRSRGRVSFGLVPSLKSKLAAAGLAVTQDPTSPHDMTLVVRYREARGKPISLNLYGTDLHCRLMLEHPREGRVLDLTIHESPEYTAMITAPYIEVVEKFQANPYFYFLGELVRGRFVSHRDSTELLITALDQELYPPARISPANDLVSPI